MARIKKVSVSDGYRLDLTFDDGLTGVVDLSGMVGKGVFDLWSDARSFRKVEIGSLGELRWDEQD